MTKQIKSNNFFDVTSMTERAGNMNLYIEYKSESEKNE